ncbi:hypothetical protein GDO86_005831 [Hymenochirus boettgeri]|uniref:Cortactin-binding protein 2 n=1 Tax=Hymenochirus boettgeri TaxID=247094 RepID=A0A8T2J653_9PIPI|nr:hypothetical protein GDO86_005831 [Hymenochirus boettgeri]
MATTEGSEEQPLCIAHGDSDHKKDFDVENLSKPELHFLLSILEGELEARDLVIEALRARRKEVFVQERYGKFNLSDPFLALQRDLETGAVLKEKKPLCSNPLTILEAVMAHCRKMQDRMSAQLAVAERRQKKLESENIQLQNLQQEHKKLKARLDEERAKNKHVVLILVKECKLLSSKIVEEAQKLEDVMTNLESEKKKSAELEEALASEKQLRSQLEAQMGAQIKQQISEFDHERELLNVKLSQEEANTKELQEEIERMKKTIEKLKEENKASQANLCKSKDKHPLPLGAGSQSVSCQANIKNIDSDSENLKKPPLNIPAKPSVVNHVITGSSKINVCTSSAVVKTGSDKKNTFDTSTGFPLNYGLSPKTEENGSSQDLTSSSSLYPNNSFCTSPASPSYLSQSMHSLHSQCTSNSINSGLSPRIQAAKFKFQANANEHDQNGNATHTAQTRELSPNSRENLVAKQMARNTVTQVLSRFTGPQGNTQLRPGLPHPIETGTYPPVAGRAGHPSHALKSRVDRGNPPPIPPKKPGLSQTPPSTHPQLKAPQNIAGKIDNKPITSAPSGSAHGVKVLNEQNVTKSSSPQLPPKPAIDMPVASAGCVIPAIGTSQVGAWPSQSPGWKQPACSDRSLVIPASIACNSSINLVSASSCNPCDSDSILVTASGWSPSLTPLLTSGGPVPLGDRSTLLHQAAAQGNVTLLSMLLNEEGLDIHNFSKDGHSALYSAAANGHTDCVKLLLMSGAQVDATVSNGFTALCAAASQGNSKCAEILISYNADVNHVSGGQTPLYLACKNGNSDMARLLLESGADRTVPTNNGWTPIHVAVDKGNTECLKLLMYYGVGDLVNQNNEYDVGFCNYKNREFTCCRNLNPVISSALINCMDREGWTAAHIAASKGFKNCLEILCNHFGLDPELPDHCNRTVHDVATDDCKHLLENLYPLRIPVRILLDEDVHLCCSSSESENGDIYAINIHKWTTWDNFSFSVTRAIQGHFSTVVSEGWGNQEDMQSNTTAESYFGTISELSFRLGNSSWSVGQMFLQSPWEFIKMNKVDKVTISVPGPKDGCLNGVAYASMIPLQTLQNFLRLVEQYHNVIFQGPEGSLQEYIVNQLACYMKQKEDAAGFKCNIVKVDVEPSLSKEQLVSIFINSGCLIPANELPPSRMKTIIVLLHLEKVSLAELLGDITTPLENRGIDNPYFVQTANGLSDAYYFHEGCFVMGTIGRPHLQSSELSVQQHFRWVHLRWDGDPMQCLLQRYLKRKVLHRFKGKIPLSDPVCKAIDWVCAVWYQLNSCLSRLGTPETLIGPKHFLSCPVAPGNEHSLVKWMANLWNVVIVPKVQEAIFFIASVKRHSATEHITGTKAPNQGQQAVVRAALSILLNKAILHGCPLSINDLHQHIPDFKGGNFSLSVSSAYQSGGRKKGQSGAWRKVSTTPRKKSKCPPVSWNKPEEKNEAVERLRDDVKQRAIVSLAKRKALERDKPRLLYMEQSLSIGSDDEVDLVKELRTMCSSKSEPDISKITDLDNCLAIFKIPADYQNSASARKPYTQQQNIDEVSSFHSTNSSESSTQKRKLESVNSKVKSLLPVPRNKATTCAPANRSSSSNTRQTEINNYTHSETWNLHKYSQKK